MAPVMCQEWRTDFLQEPFSMRVVPRSMIRSRIMSRPGICNSIPGRAFLFHRKKNLEPESQSAKRIFRERREDYGIFDRC